MKKQRIFSGVQPSGNIHLGNYLGAIKNWVEIYENYDSIFCVVDMHAITSPQEPNDLRKKIIEVAKIYLACGINPEKAIVFVQSDVPVHCELMWILNTITKTGELFKMTQFKDKAGIKGDFSENFTSIDCGLMNYPILMAGDILLYDTEIVPVGQDQVQHIELARDLAKRFNHKFGESFIVPKVSLKKSAMRIMSLDDPKKKMSKSNQSVWSRIELLDKEDVVREKIKRAVTDSEKTIEYREDRLAIKNLLDIYSQIEGKDPLKIAKFYENTGYGKFKKDLAEKLIVFLNDFQEKYDNISDEKVCDILEEGAKKAHFIAEKKIKIIKNKVGLGF